METTNQTDSEVKPVEISSEERTLERLHSIIPQKKIRKKLYLSLLIFFCFVIVASIFLIGYFSFNWFQKEPNNIVKIEKEQYQIDYFKESKKITSIINEKSKFEGSTQIQNIDIDFFVIINLKTRLTYFGTKDNLYNATLVILRTNISNEYANLVTGQFNINDEKEINEMLKNPNITENPFATFSFYENGTLLGIYLPSDINKFTASLIIDLIEKVTPRISKEYFEKEEINKVAFKLKNNSNTSNETTLLEIHQLKEFKDKYTEVSFNKSSTHSNIERKVNEENKLENIKSNSELVLNSQKNYDEENYVDLGFNDYHLNIESDIKLIEQKKQKNTVDLINKLIEKTKLMESTSLIKLFEEIDKEKQINETETIVEEQNESEEEIEYLIEEEENNIDLKEGKLRNLFDYKKAYSYAYPLLKSNLLGKNLQLNYGISIAREKGENSINAIFNDLTIPFGKSKDFDLKNSAKKIKKENKKDRKKITIGRITFYYVVSITLQIRLEGFFNVNFEVNPSEFITKLSAGANIIGSLSCGNILQIEGGISGNLITVDVKHTFIPTRTSYETNCTVDAYGAGISLFVSLSTFTGKTLYEKYYQIHKGWRKKK